MPFQNTVEFLENYTPINRLSTVLVQQLLTGETVAYVDDVSNWPAMGWFSVDREVIFYREIDAINKTLGTVANPLERGVNGSSEADHGVGIKVSQRINAEAFIEMLKTARKRTEINASAAQVAADTVSDQNLSGLHSRIDINELRIIPKGGSTNFKIEFFRRDTFLGVDKVYESVPLSSVQSSIDAASNSGQDKVYLATTAGFMIGELAAIEESAVREFIYVTDIISGDYIVGDTNLANSFTAAGQATLVHRELKNFLYEDYDWSGELHVRITNFDPSNPIQIDFNILAEVSD